jgi:hypothetical protein
LRRRARRAGPTVPPVKKVLTVVGGGGEDLVDAARREPDTAPLDPALGQATGDRLHPQRSPFPTSRQIEDLPHDEGLLVVDDEDFLVLGATALCDPGLIAVGRVRAALSREPNLTARRLGIPSSGSGCGGGSPRPERFVSEDTERVAGCEMALDVEGVEDSGVNGQEALG